MHDQDAASPAEHEPNEGRRIMSREELYALVWQTPMIKLARTFGLSDVGLRKICAKHDIPTPPGGYWAKLAHGKAIRQLPLPPRAATRPIEIKIRPYLASPHDTAANEDGAGAIEPKPPPIAVAAERPAKLHPVAAATAAALRTAKTNHEGFKEAKAPGAVAVILAPSSIDRALCLIDAFARAAEERGHSFAEHDKGVRMVVDSVPLAWRLYEIRGRTTHIPTAAEPKEQARRERDRQEWPSLYSSDRKPYDAWDYLPSGKLAMTLTDATRFCWGRDGQLGHWYDRKGKRLEQYLSQAMAVLPIGAAEIKHRLAVEAEQKRKEAEELESRRREQARRERAMKRHEFLLNKADHYARLAKLSAFAEYVEQEVYEYSNEPVDRLIGELKSFVSVMRAGLTRDALAEEIAQAQLFTADDPIAEPPED